MFFVKTNAHVRLFYLLPPRIWVARGQTQSWSFSMERKETGSEVFPRYVEKLYDHTSVMRNSGRPTIKLLQIHPQFERKACCK